MTHAQLMAALKRAGYEPFAYAGRFMYGVECVAVSVDTGAPTLALPPNWRVDQFGKGLVFYWPEILWQNKKEST